MLPALLAGIFGIGLVETAYADNANEDLQAIAVKERQRIEELLRSRGIRHGSYPRFSVAVKGQKVIARRTYDSIIPPSNLYLDDVNLRPIYVK